MESVISDGLYQDRILPHVSRTFALTIPQLPPGLRAAVTNAYLLCRIADTIEDEPALSAAETLAYLRRFRAAVSGRADPAPLAAELARRLSDRTLPTEADLVRNMERVIRVTSQLAPTQRAAIQRCVEVMCYGMPRFQHNASVRGLPTLHDLNDYCYFVAGVVGEMLTDLFCAYSPVIESRRSGLQQLAVSFAQGLQMTNILKDLWEDRSRGACWLPQDVFARHGIDLAQLSAQQPDPRFSAGMHELIGVAHAHLRDALEYTLLIPEREVGIRRFCLWAVGLAILTLRRIDANPGFTAGSQVKITRSAVTWTRVLTSASVRSNWTLRRLWSLAARGVPIAPAGSVRRTAPDGLEAALDLERVTDNVASLRTAVSPPPSGFHRERALARSDGSSAT